MLQLRRGLAATLRGQVPRQAGAAALPGAVRGGGRRAFAGGDLASAAPGEPVSKELVGGWATGQLLQTFHAAWWWVAQELWAKPEKVG